MTDLEREAAPACAVQQLADQRLGALGPVGAQDVVEGLEPLARLLRVYVVANGQRDESLFRAG